MLGEEKAWPPLYQGHLILSPPPSLSVKPRGSSHPRPPLCAHLLRRTTRPADEARGRLGANSGPGGQDTWLWMDLGGWRLDSGRIRCLRAVLRLPWRYCLAVFTASQRRVGPLLPIRLFLHRPAASLLFWCKCRGLAGWRLGLVLVIFCCSYWTFTISAFHYF